MQLTTTSFEASLTYNTTQRDIIGFSGLHAENYQLTSGTVCDTYDFIQNDNSFSIVNSFNATGTGKYNPVIQSSQYTTLTIAGSKMTTWQVNSYQNNITTEFVTNKSGYVSSTQLADGYVSYSLTGNQYTRFTVSYSKTPSITHDYLIHYTLTKSNNDTWEYSDHLLTRTDFDTVSTVGPFTTSTNYTYWYMAPHIPFSMSTVLRTYREETVMEDSTSSTTWGYGNGYDTSVFTDSVSEVVSNEYATSSITSYYSSTVSVSSSQFYTQTYSAWSISTTKYTETLSKDGEIAQSTSFWWDHSWTYLSSTETITSSGLRSSYSSVSMSTTIETSNLNPLWSYEYVESSQMTQDFGDRYVSLDVINYISIIPNDQLLSYEYGYKYQLTETLYSDNTTNTATIIYSDCTAGSTSITGTSTSKVTTATGSQMAYSQGDNLTLTYTATDYTYFMPEMTANGKWIDVTIENIVTGNWDFFSTMYTSETETHSELNTQFQLSGATSMANYTVVTGTATNYTGAPPGYLFSNTSYSEGISSTTHESYFDISSSGQVNFLSMLNEAGYRTDISITGGITETCNLVLTGYIVEMTSPTATDLYDHFETSSSVLQYTESSVSSDTLYKSANEVTFWYVKPDMNVAFSRTVWDITKTVSRETTETAWQDWSSGITASKSTYGEGTIAADNLFCVLNHCSATSIWTESYNTETILTSMETSTIQNVIGGISATSVTTMSNTYDFGFYSQTGNFGTVEGTDTYWQLRFATTGRISDWINSYTYYTERTIDEGVQTTWYSTLTSAVWDTWATTTVTGNTLTWSYTTQEHWWINETKSIGLGTASTTLSTRTLTTVTGNQIINNYSSETYENSYTITYTGISYYDEFKYTESIGYYKSLQANYHNSKEYFGTAITANLPLIYQSESATCTKDAQHASYSYNSNGKTNYITRSVSVIVTSESPINFTYQSISSTDSSFDINTVPVSTSRDTSFLLTSHYEAYSVLDSQGWYRAGFETAINSSYVPDITAFSELTNFSAVMKNTHYIWYTYSHEITYDSSSYTDYEKMMSSIEYHKYQFNAGTKIDMIFDATDFVSYGEIDLVNGTYNSEAKLVVGTSYSADTSLWTVYHYSEVDSQVVSYDTSAGTTTRGTTTLSGPVLVESFVWTNPNIYNSESYYIVNSYTQGELYTTDRWGTTFINGTFYTVDISGSISTYAHGTSLETQLVEIESKYPDNTISGITTVTYTTERIGESAYNTTSSNYLSWSGKSYTANNLSVYNVATTLLTMVDETSYLYTGYQFTSTLDTYYITSVYGSNYTLSKAGSYTTIGYTQSGLETTRDYFISARNGYKTEGVPYETFTSTAKDKVVSIMSSSIGYMTVTYYNSEYSQTVEAVAEFNDYYTTYYTTSVFGVETLIREPKYITGISTNTTSFTGRPGTINYESTYISGTETRTKGFGY